MGWPLLAIETEMNGDSKSTNERAPSLVSSFDLSCRYKGFLFSLGCSNWPSSKYLLPKVSDNSIAEADALKYVCIIIGMFHLHINAKILLFSISMLYLCKATVRTYV
jgi:hypothetical protein